MPRPGPPGKPVQQAIIDTRLGGKHLRIDLRKLDDLQGVVVVGAETEYHKAEFHFLPATSLPLPQAKPAVFIRTAKRTYGSGLA